MSDEVATPEQKLNIANFFIMSSPTGEVDDVLADVTKLVGDSSILTAETTASMLRNYNNQELVWAADPEDAKHPILVAPAGQIADDQYLDPNSGRVLKFDHKARKFTEVVADMTVTLAEPVAAYRSAIQAAVLDYLTRSFKPYKAVTAVYGADDGTITVYVSAKNVNLANYWTGGWRSIYTLNVSSQGETELKSSIKTNVHYFEAGNVQLHSSTERTHTVTVHADAAATGKAVAAQILAVENEFQNALEEMYVNMHTTTFKSMRRFWPINRQPMNWNLAAHNLASEVAR